MDAYYTSHLEGNGQEMADSHVLGVFGTREALGPASPTSYLENARVPQLVISETDTYDFTLVLENRVPADGAFHFFHDRDRNHAALQAALFHAEDCEARDRILSFIRSPHAVPDGPG